ncbi:MAG TPA: hypothetical protein VGO50_20200 [Pyrinomonadaceae bacterium]|jgi:hypothetical protein|nr:hypothetical protein [Pyrinomonadaceae bacterium]
MLRSYRKLFLKLAAVCVLAAGVYVAQGPVSAKTDCPICPWPYSCNHSTGECECDCPNPDGSCPQSCA